MRFVPALLVSITLAAVGRTPAVRQAMDDVARVGKLHADGAASRRDLELAEKRLLDARDQQILDRLLYGETIQVENLTESQATEIVDAAKRNEQREQARFEALNLLVEQGVRAKSTLEPLREELERARRTVEVAQTRATLLNELVGMVRAELDALEHQAEEEAPKGPRPVMEHFNGAGILAANDVKKLTLAYEKQFAKPLPVSARGETALHKSLGFDHRGRIDVALNPDQEEGQWLRHYLESVKIPYVAFRKWVPGKATAPHIHVGPPSTRLRSAD